MSDPLISSFTRRIALVLPSPWVRVAARALMFLGCVGLIVATTADCSPSVAATDTSLVSEIKVLDAGDITYVGDILTYKLPLFLNSGQTPVSGISVGIQNSQPGVVRYGGDAQLVSSNPSPTYDLTALAVGTATLTLTASGVHFTNNLQVVPPVTVVVVPRPTQIDIPSSIVLLVGQRVAISGAVRGTTGGPLITRGDLAWTVGNSATIGYGYQSEGTTPTYKNPAYLTDAIIVGLKAGTTTLTVGYTGPAGVTLTRTVDVYVLPPGISRVVIDTNSFASAVGPFVVSGTFHGYATARLFDPSGTQIDPAAIRYVSRDPAIATIDQANCVKPTIDPSACIITFDSRTINDAALLQRPGHVASVWIVATAGSAQPDSVLFTFYPRIAALDLSPTVSTISLGASRVFTATPRDALGQAIPDAIFAVFRLPTTLTGPDRMVRVVEQNRARWTVFADSVPVAGTVVMQLSAYTPELVPIRSPTATITVNAVDHVDVSPVGFTMNVGTTQAFTAAAIDGGGRSVTLPLNTTWRSSAITIASVSSTGIVTGNSAGTATIFATIGGIEGGTPVTVSVPAANAVASVRLAPTTISMYASDPPVTLTATLKDAGGVTTTGLLGWSTDASSVAAVSPVSTAPGVITSQVTAFGPTGGTTAVTAFNAASGLFGRALVRVGGSSGVTRIAANVFHVPLAIGATFQFTAKSYNKLEVEIVGSVVTWETSNPAVATVDPVTGLVTAVSTGGAIITARRDGQYSTGAVTVGNAGAIKGPLASTGGQYLSGAKATVRLAGTQVALVTVDPGTNQFYVPGLAAGSYQVSVDVNGYPTQTFTVVIPVTFGTVLMTTITFP